MTDRTASMLIAEFEMESDHLRTALDSAPEIVITNEEHYATDGHVRVMFWAHGGDFEAFEDGLAADPTVPAWRTLTETADRRLYRADFIEDEAAATTIPTWRDREIVLLEATGGHDGWDVRMRFPDRDSLVAHRESLREHGIDFELQTLYSEEDVQSPAEASLTSAQREALVSAYERGYFDVPRRSSQSEIADLLDITPQSLSERLQRGIATLIETTLLSGPETT